MIFTFILGILLGFLLGDIFAMYIVFSHFGKKLTLDSSWNSILYIPREPINEEAKALSAGQFLCMLEDYRNHKLTGEQFYNEIKNRFHIPGEVDKCTKCKEYETQLNAWFSIFGTTQLTHAQARLEAAERKAEKFDRQAKEPHDKT